MNFYQSNIVFLSVEQTIRNLYSLSKRVAKGDGNNKWNSFGMDAMLINGTPSQHAEKVPGLQMKVMKSNSTGVRSFSNWNICGDLRFMLTSW